ncbi:MAG: nodulation protein NfeD [Syntrophomonas sp.]|nr:nodulation protein NfeD [Syntrophomonas sp.]
MHKRVRWFILLFIIIGFLVGTITATATAQPLIFSIQVDGTVTAGTAAHISRLIKTAEQSQAEAVVIILNTPGGLASSTLDIVEAVSAARVPVITFITPRGAIAASAGTYILLSGNLSAMSPGTTCGAAMPVKVSGTGETNAADQKTINFMAEHMKSLAALRGRPSELAERFVTENLSLNNKDAQSQGIVDLEAEDMEELLQKLEGRQVQTADGQRTLKTAGAQVEYLPMNISERLVHIISNPMLAMLLVMIGVYGIIIAISVPGIYVPEILGSICLILGFYGMGLFEVNFAAGLLILLGVLLLAAEAFTPALGILGVGGIASIVLGILFLPTEPLLPISWWYDFRSMAIGIGVIGAGLLVVMLKGIWRLRHLRTSHGELLFNGQMGLVIKDLNPHGLVRIQGEIWQAQSGDEQEIAQGSSVRIIGKTGLILLVEPVPDSCD